MVNVALATEVLAKITANPEAHTQSVWVEEIEGDVDWNRTELPPVETDPDICETPHCVAGWALAYSDRPIRNGRVTPPGERWARYVVQIGTRTDRFDDKGKRIYEWTDTADGEIPWLAMNLLDISPNQAQFLFFEASNSEAKAFLAKLIWRELRGDIDLPGMKEIEDDDGAFGPGPWFHNREGRQHV